MTTDSFSEREVENAIELTCECIEFFQDTLDMPRGAILETYIYPWAKEAESEWQRLQASTNDDEAETPYYDFISNFAEGKKAEIAATR